jgi:hypothetical protein
MQSNDCTLYVRETTYTEQQKLQEAMPSACGAVKDKIP